ncbi:hypothetical protein NQZ68_010767 [Dissostichus eleginoides]|nr:hypothetical protein NQZ68_010767 [Dissostichus eleginoides]
MVCLERSALDSIKLVPLLAELEETLHDAYKQYSHSFEHMKVTVEVTQVLIIHELILLRAWILQHEENYIGLEVSSVHGPAAQEFDAEKSVIEG